MPREVYFLNFQLEGQCRMSQGGRSTIIKPGEFALVDSTLPYSNDYFTEEWNSIRSEYLATCCAPCCGTQMNRPPFE